MRYLSLSGLVLCGLLINTQRVAAEERPIRVEVSAFEYGALGRFFGQDKIQHFGLSRLLLETDGFALHEPDWEGGERRLIVNGATVIGANEDALFIDTVNVAFDPVTGIAIGTLEFAGGTGRFADAVGSAEVLLLFDFYGIYTVEILIDGTVDY